MTRPSQPPIRRSQLRRARDRSAADEHQPAVQGGMRAHAAHEALERVHYRRRIGEVVGMVHLDVRDDGAGRMVVQEVVAELVGLDQERRSPAGADRCAPRADEGADLHGRIQSGRNEQVAEQRGRRRLAVRAGHPEADAPGCRLSSPRSACHVSTAMPRSVCGGELGVPGHGSDRGRDRDAGDAVEVRGIVARRRTGYRPRRAPACRAMVRPRRSRRRWPRRGGAGARCPPLPSRRCR